MFSCELLVGRDVFASSRAELSNVLFPVELEIVQRLYSGCLEGYAPDRDKKWDQDTPWTHRVKETLSQLGKEQGLLVYPQIVDGKFQGEWLFDLIWIDAKQDSSGKGFDWKATRSLKLACECEWAQNEDNVLEDFLKLTFVLADIRLFVYTNPTARANQGGNHPVSLCKRVCPLSRGFRYLAIGFPTKTDGVARIDSWVA